MSSEDEAGKGADAVDAADEMPLDFATFVLSLSHGGMMHLGDIPEPGGATPEPDLALARQTIDILALLEAKTRGNLTGDEERILSAALHDLKQRFIEVSKAT